MSKTLIEQAQFEFKNHQTVFDEDRRRKALFGKVAAELERMKKQRDALGFEFPDQWKHPCFGMTTKEGETLKEAIQRWYLEFDHVLSNQHKELERLQAVVEKFQVMARPKYKHDPGPGLTVSLLCPDCKVCCATEFHKDDCIFKPMEIAENKTQAAALAAKESAD